MTYDDCARAVQTHSARVQRWAAAYAPPGTDPRDVAQDVFRVLVVHRDHVALPAVREWLHTTTWNVCLDLKKKARRRARRGEVLVDVVPDVPASVDLEKTLVSAQMVPIVRKALAEVEPHRRRVVEAVIREDRSIREIAASERVPESTARTWYRTAIEDLRGIFARWRAAEQRQTGGSTSWGLMGVVVGWNARAVAWWARARALLTRAWPKLLAFAGAATGVSGVIAAVALLTGGAPASVALPLDVEELPAIAFAAPFLTFEPSVPAAPSSVEKPGTPVYTAPERPALGPRRRHDAHAHFEQQAFGDAAPRRP